MSMYYVYLIWGEECGITAHHFKKVYTSEDLKRFVLENALLNEFSIPMTDFGEDEEVTATMVSMFSNFTHASLYAAAYKDGLNWQNSHPGDTETYVVEISTSDIVRVK